MNLPNLPTDNLYKFLAIAGFVQGILALGFLAHRIETSLASNAEIRVGIEEMEYSNKENMRSIVAQEKSMEEIDDEMEKALSLSAEEALANIKDLREEVRAAHEKFRSLRDATHSDFLLKRSELRRKLELANAYSSATNSIFRTLLFAGLTGFLISLLGFILWFFRLQRYQDALVREEARRACEQP